MHCTRFVHWRRAHVHLWAAGWIHGEKPRRRPGDKIYINRVKCIICIICIICIFYIIFIRLAGPGERNHALWAQAKQASSVRNTYFAHPGETPPCPCGGHWDHSLQHARRAARSWWCFGLLPQAVTQSRASLRVMDADSGMSTLGPYLGQRRCHGSIKAFKSWAWTEITHIMHITQK